MHLIRGLHCLPQAARQAVITVGHFDGLHQGHQALIAQCLARARAAGRPALLMTFHPLPKAYFAKEKSWPRLTVFRDQVKAVAALGIDYFCVLRFDARLARLSPEDFITHILIQQLAMTGIVLGDDFRFGAKRAGDVDLLRAYSAAGGYTVDQLPALCVDGLRVSSSGIRGLLAADKFDQAMRLLGRPYRLSGRIVYGDQRGRLLGFPTLNIHTQHNRFVFAGIFVVSVVLNGQSHQGVASIGRRPMYARERDHCEVHVLDFNAEVYGFYCEITLLKRLRGEIKFNSEAALVDQMKADVQATRAYFMALDE
jgi:riboflavin kinase/FMN adenylyltransferase